MKVLFVRSCNARIDPISTNQGESLRRSGIEIEYYNLYGVGLSGYLKNILPFRNTIRSFSPDIVHAHYSLIGYLSKISVPNAKIVCSLMGSDVNDSSASGRIILKIFAGYLWDSTIVKTNSLKEKLGLTDAIVIPNGVNFSHFKPVDQNYAKIELGLEISKSYILFASDPDRVEKNYNLALEIYDKIKEVNSKTILLPLKNIEVEKMPLYYNAADVLLLTSFSEGSPNVIKEAMACNCPIVSTNVGDVKDVVSETDSCFVSNFNVDEMASWTIDLVTNPRRTNGRNKILHLDDKIIAEKLIGVYSKIINS